MALSAGIMAAGSLVGSAYSAHQQRASARDALAEQKDQAAKAEASRPQATKAPGMQSVQSGEAGAGQAAGAPGVAQTFLTGASGVDPTLLNLGKSTLLGGGGGG